MTLWHEAQKVIAQGALTNSKHPKSYVYGVYPTHVTMGRGAYLWDENGKQYIDYICGLGANLLGYGNEKINSVIRDAISIGYSHSLGTPFEIKTAKALCSVFPWVDKWKFLKTGSGACSAAIRIARAHTGRKKVLSLGYHGWHDAFTSLTPPATGVPVHPDMACFERISQIDSDTAAVIIEPIIAEVKPNQAEWLQQIRDVCDKHGAMLIFDEIITGFRYKSLSVAKAYGVIPDLIVIGKSLGNGMPISAVGGETDVMDSPYFVSTTFAGEVLSLAAAEKVVSLLQKSDEYNVNRLWEKGQEWLDVFNSFAPGLVQIKGYPTRGIFQGEEKNLALFFQEAAKAGLLFCRSWFYNFSHPALCDESLHAVKDIFYKLKSGKVVLEGDMPQNPIALMERLKHDKQRS